jgi:hypothetical protein
MGPPNKHPPDKYEQKNHPTFIGDVDIPLSMN